MAISDLHEEILAEIFSRLPPKSVGRCRCLAKVWRTLLSTPYFLESHFSRKPNEESLLLITPSGSIATVKDGAFTNLDLPIRCSYFSGSCDGLVLLVNEDFHNFLVNPVTLEHIKLPEDSPPELMRDPEYSLPGLGYDRLSDDYKVVSISHYFSDDGTFVDVYSVNSGVWRRRVCLSPYDHGVTYVMPGAFAYGALHWVAFSREPGNRPVIAAFNLVDEVFDEIPPPTGLDVNLFLRSSLEAFGGRLCVVVTASNSNSNSVGDIWIMKEYGVGDSWAKFSIDVDNDWHLGYIGDEEIVLETEGNTLAVYNLKERTLRDLLADGVPAMSGGTFVESLVSPVGRR